MYRILILLVYLINIIKKYFDFSVLFGLKPNQTKLFGLIKFWTE